MNDFDDSAATPDNESAPDAARREGPAHRRPRRRLWRRLLLAMLCAVGLLAAITGGTAVAAAFTPGNESFSVKWADWIRAHGGGSAITDCEDWWYSHHQPKKGGAPAQLNPLHPANVAPPTLTPHTSVTTLVATPKPLMISAPAAIPSVVHPPVPGEGLWQPIGPTIDGSPSMYEAQFRADDTYTSQITTAVWIDPFRLNLSLIPGSNEPGGTWPHAPHVLDSELPGVVAAFNGGFRFQDAHGGFYLDGRTAVPLVNGAASFVIYRSGRIDIGTWGSEVQMGPNVIAVLQNLVPMVDNGQVSPSATYDDAAVWGATVKTSIVVPRSGIGVTKKGALVYVAGPALSARTLAESLQRAGAVRAMTLDINPYWVTFNLFSHPEASNPSYVVGSKLYPQMQRSADRYLPPTWESRDFVEITDS